MPERFPSDDTAMFTLSLLVGPK